MEITIGTIVATFDNVFYVIEGTRNGIYVASRLTKDFELDKRYTRYSAGLSKGSITKVVVPVDFKNAM